MFKIRPKSGLHPHPLRVLSFMNVQAPFPPLQVLSSGIHAYFYFTTFIHLSEKKNAPIALRRFRNPKDATGARYGRQPSRRLYSRED
jgi:hypothetical protein